MDATHLDTLAKTLAPRLSRRAGLRAGGTGLVATVLAAAGWRRTAAQDVPPAASPAASGEDGAFLFVQTFASGSFRPNPGAGTPQAEGTPAPGGGASYLLELTGHHGETIYFSDRPQRIFGEAPTERFLAGLGFGAANPPNAALVAQTDGGDDVVVLELVEPTYDPGMGTLAYGAEILAEYAGEGLAHVAERQLDEALPESFGRASLFIDDCKDLVGCHNCPRCGYFDDVLNPVDWYVGPIPGGPIGQCWNWSSVGCQPCRNDQAYYNDVCNRAYPEACQGTCKAWDHH